MAGFHFHANQLVWQSEKVVFELLKPYNKKPSLFLFAFDMSQAVEMERLKTWALVAQRLAHQTKTPLATILLAVQRLQKKI